MTKDSAYSKMLAIYKKASTERPDGWRFGQAVFNFTFGKYPEQANMLRGSDVDCFYNDDKINEFIETMIELLRSK